MKKLRISIVEYLNTAPLVWGFTDGPLTGKYDLSFTVPSQCAESLRRGDADIAIIPSIEYQRIDPFKFLPQGREHAPYGMAADGKNNLYFMDFGDQNIGRVDAETGAVTIFPTPTPNSRPRRTMLDDQGRLWFAEFAANKLAMFDTKAETFKEWDVPTPYTYPYDVFCDRHGELWSAGMASDRVLRFDPQSGRSVEYLLPRPANIRRVFVDNSTDPVKFWAGNNHGAEILRLEPLD